MLDRFIQGLKHIVQCKTLKDNPSTFSDACMIAKRIAQLENSLGGIHPSIYIPL